MATTQNTSVVIRDTTICTSINPSLIDDLWLFSKVTGLSLSGALNRAVGQWLEVEAPVYMDHAKRAGGQKA